MGHMFVEKLGEIGQLDPFVTELARELSEGLNKLLLIPSCQSGKGLSAEVLDGEIVLMVHDTVVRLNSALLQRMRPIT